MTQIFKTYSDFYNREDKKVNGVSEEFASDHPDYEKENETNEGCWNCSDCSDCSDCSGCSDCYGCSRLTNAASVQQNNVKAFPEIPFIENIHQKVFNAVSKPDALNMADWHTCETTHCRAGWVEHLAGEAGKKLAQATSTAFAAMQIYKASSPIKVSPVRFYEDNETALADIKRCAEEEQNLLTK